VWPYAIADGVDLRHSQLRFQDRFGFDEMGTPFGWDGTTETAMTSSARSRSLRVAALTISVEAYTGEASVQ